MIAIDVDLKETDRGTFDIDWDDDGDFVMTDNYDTAIKMSILAERRAKPYEIALPEYRRGWIGNLLYTNGEENGSGVWMYEQRRLTTATINGYRDEAEKGLLWTVEDGIFNQASVDVKPESGRVRFDVRLTTNDQKTANTTIKI